MKSKRALLLLTVLVVLVGGGFLYASHAWTLNILPPDRAVVSFRRPLTRTELQELLREYNLTPTAIYMVNAGLVGTYRTYEVKNIDEFFQTSQARTIEAMQKGLRSNTLRLKRFIEQHSEEEVLADENLQQEMRSLLNIRFQLQGTLKAAQGEMPSIYAAEVIGKDLAQLQSDERIASVQEFNLIEARILRRRPPVPTARVQQEFVAPKLQSMSVHDMYQYMKSLVSKHESGGAP